MTFLVKAPVASAVPAIVLYPANRKELVQVKIAFALRWRGRAAILREIRFYCQYHELSYQISTDGNFWQSRHVLKVQGQDNEMETLVRMVEALLRRPGMIGQGAMAST